MRAEPGPATPTEGGVPGGLGGPVMGAALADTLPPASLFVNVLSFALGCLNEPPCAARCKSLAREEEGLFSRSDWAPVCIGGSVE